MSPPTRRLRRLLRLAALAFSATAAPAQTPPGTDVVPVRAPPAAAARGERPFKRVGRLPKVVDEASGLAASRRADDLLWTLNDSGADPVLHAISTEGAFRGSVRVDGALNRDWEDLASFTRAGRAWLLIADLGDNFAQRLDCRLYLVPEPDPAELRPDRPLVARVARSIVVRYPEGPRDCEAVAVDPEGTYAYLLSKRTRPSVIYRVPLWVSPPEATPMAERVGKLAPMPFRFGYGSQPTALDFSADGRRAVVLTYADVLVFRRAEGETWAAALGRKPDWRVDHDLRQGEAAAFSADGRVLYLTSEGKGAPLLRGELGN